MAIFDPYRIHAPFKFGTVDDVGGRYAGGLLGKWVKYNEYFIYFNPMLRQRTVFMMTLPGLINYERAGPSVLVPGILTH